MPWDGARGQNLGHCLKEFFYRPILEQTFTDSLSDMAPPFDTSNVKCDIILDTAASQHFRVKVTVAILRQTLSLL